GEVTGVAITHGGHGWSSESPPAVRFGPPGFVDGVVGTTAEGVAVVDDHAGVVTGVTITVPGSGYAEAPVVAFTPRGGIHQGAGGGARCMPVHLSAVYGSPTIEYLAATYRGDDTRAIECSTGTANSATRTVRGVHPACTG